MLAQFGESGIPCRREAVLNAEVVRVEHFAGDPGLLEDRLHVVGHLRVNALPAAELHHLVEDVVPKSACVASGLSHLPP